MKHSQQAARSQKPIKQTRLARALLRRAEGIVESVRQQTNFAKRTRENADEVARRASCLIKKAKTELTEVKAELDKAELELAATRKHPANGRNAESVREKNGF
jgi:hypothetical protein